MPTVADLTLAVLEDIRAELREMKEDLKDVRFQMTAMNDRVEIVTNRVDVLTVRVDRGVETLAARVDQLIKVGRPTSPSA
jgi:hypothetical protein